MDSRVVIIGSDHAGFRMKEELKAFLASQGRQVIDVGVPSEASADYPPIAHQVASRVAAAGGREVGLLVCGSGIGMSIAANRTPGVRAALCATAELARLSRQHNDANCLVLAGRFTPSEEARAALTAFLETPFEGGRHVRRVELIDARGERP